MAEKTDLTVAKVLSFYILGNNGFYGSKNALNGEIDPTWLMSACSGVEVVLG